MSCFGCCDISLATIFGCAFLIFIAPDNTDSPVYLYLGCAFIGYAGLGILYNIIGALWIHFVPWRAVNIQIREPLLSQEVQLPRQPYSLCTGNENSKPMGEEDD